MSGPIQPPFTLYTLDVAVGFMGSPAVPVVDVLEEGLDGSFIARHSLTLEQAIDLAEKLTTTAVLHPGRAIH